MIRKIIPILLIIVGAIGLFFSAWDIGGDIGTLALLSGVIAILSGIGFLTIPSK